MSTARFIVGDALEVLASLPENSVDLVVSSPPFLALRSYLPADHEHKAKEIGSEATPGEFIDTMLDVVEACARVLAPHGSLVFELGDTYAGSGGTGGDYLEGGMREGAPGTSEGSARRKRAPATQKQADLLAPHTPSANGKVDQKRIRDYRRVSSNGNRNRDNAPGWPLDKSKVLIPQLFAISLAYGFNPLTGRTTDPWRVRNTVAWCRPNPPVGRDGDKFRPATSFLTVATKARDRFWDGDAVRVPFLHPEQNERNGARGGPTSGTKGPNLDRGDLGAGNFHSTTGGAPLLDWWEIPTAPYKGSHYATYPPQLVVPIVKSMCPGKVCNAVVCNHCGHAHPAIRQSDIEAVAMGREAVSLPAAAQEELRHLRDVLRRQEPVYVLPQVSGAPEVGAVRGKRAGVEEDGCSGSDLSPGLHPATDADAPGSGARQVRAGAPDSDGAEAGPLAGAVGARTPPQRGQGRQPTRESGDRRQQGAPRGRDLPSLRDRLLHSLICPGHVDNQRGFGVCGKPSTRITETKYAARDGSGYVEGRSWADVDDGRAKAAGRERNGNSAQPPGGDIGSAERETLGWSDCGHDSWRPGHVLDPFGGSGTTAAVATGHGYDCTLIDLDERNAELAYERIGGLFMSVERFVKENVA